MSADEVQTALADYLTVANVAGSRREARELRGSMSKLAELERAPVGVPHRYLLADYDRDSTDFRAKVDTATKRLSANDALSRGVRVVEGATHLIPQDRPREVADEVLGLLASIHR